MKYTFKLPEDYNGLYFQENYLKERFNQIINFYGIRVYDTEHAIEQFEKRFPELDTNDYKKVLLDGLQKIADTWNFEENQYVIISKSLYIKIPIQIRPDRNYTNIIVGATPSTLDSRDHKYNLRNEIEVLVEKTKNEHGYAQIQEFTEKEVGYIDQFWFNNYIEDGTVWKDFKEIEVE